MTPSPNPAEWSTDALRRARALSQWPQAHFHTQWPGKGAPGDPVFDHFFASQVTGMAGSVVQFNRNARLALLDKIGPAISDDAFAIRSVHRTRVLRPAEPAWMTRSGMLNAQPPVLAHADTFRPR
jgi:hypothetical protein